MSKRARNLDWDKVQRKLGGETAPEALNALGEPQLTGEVEHQPAVGVTTGTTLTGQTLVVMSIAII